MSGTELLLGGLVVVLVALTLLVGPFVQRRTIDRQEITPEFRDAVLRSVVAGLRATAAATV
jgi:hypothetical protein